MDIRNFLINFTLQIIGIGVAQFSPLPILIYKLTP
jgi:hypothetical protein